MRGSRLTPLPVLLMRENYRMSTHTLPLCEWHAAEALCLGARTWWALADGLSCAAQTPSTIRLSDRTPAPCPRSTGDYRLSFSHLSMAARINSTSDASGRFCRS